MKKSLFIGLVAVLGLISCSRKQEIDVPDSNLSIFAKTESPADTKTVVESGVHVFWEPGDEIAVFTGDQSAKFTTDITTASGTATFKGTFGDATWPEDLDLWAVYPFSEDALFDGETITTTLPSEQVAREGSFGKDMNLAIAHSNSSTLQFYNVGGGIRFSVTEEGIKKVMFEGLSGEIISGKVKIGMDESGKPEIREITGGSQFITLLPPDGSETFQKDTWYYIVAIPGSLEGGFKLRFYKDSDYARKVSEKAAEIKRSVFGNVEKADDGIEYEAQTTNFPETEEEWDLTDSRIIEITPAVQGILANCQEENFTDNSIERIVSEIEKLDGVQSVRVSDSKNLIIAQLFNEVYINILVSPFFFTRASVMNNQVQARTRALSPQVSSLTAQTTQPTEKKALVLLPLYDYVLSKFAEEGLEEHPIQLYNRIITSFENCGFKVDPYYNNDATLGKFRGKNLQGYDIVYINTHGCEDAVLADGTVTTALMTMSPVSDNKARRLSSIPSYCLWEHGSYYWFTTEALKYDSPHFNNTWVFMHACESLGNSDMYSYFLDKGAAAYSGFIDSASGNSSIDLAATMIEAFTSGLEVYEATKWTRTHSVDAWGNLWNSYMDMLIFGTQRNSNLSSFYLFDPHPYDLSNDVNGNLVTLKWKLPPHSGRYSYQLFINDSPIGIEAFENETNEYSYEYTASSPGSYSWYVKITLRYNGEVMASYRTDGEDFTVKEEPVVPDPIIPYSESVDLGLPSGTKWARFNVGASSPEEYGDHFAWGETEPKELYTWENYEWCKGTQNSLIKYCYDSEYGYNGFTDNLKTLLPEDDAASVNWKGYWRIPTNAEAWELESNTTISLVEYNGSKVFELKSKINGNVIYFPIAGYYNYDEYPYPEILDGGEYRGFYWCSDIDYTRTYDGSNYCISNDEYYGFREGCSWGYYTWARRSCGFTIRPVYKH